MRRKIFLLIVLWPFSVLTGQVMEDESKSVERIGEGLMNPIVTRTSEIIVVPEDDSVTIYSEESDAPIYLSIDGHYTFDLMFRSHVQREVMMSDEQKNKLAEVRSNAVKKLKKLGEITGPQKNLTNLRRLEKEITQEYHDRISRIVLPHQWEALSNLKSSYSVRASGLTSLIVDGMFDRKLNVTDAQKKKLLKESEETAKAFIADIQKLQEKYMKRIISPLDKEQRELLEPVLEAMTHGRKVPDMNLLLRNIRYEKTSGKLR